MADQDGRWGLISAGRESPDAFFFGLQVNEPYDWEGVGGGERAYKWKRGLRNGSLWYRMRE